MTRKPLFVHCASLISRNLLAGCIAVSLGVPVAAQGLADHGFSPEQTQRVVISLREGFRLCGEVPEAYRPDCTKFALRRAARKIGNVPAYWEAEVAMSRVSRQLDSMVREHADPEASSLRQGGYRMKAVRADILPAVRDVTAASVQRALEILRSGTSAEVQYFAPIAEAIEKHRRWP